MLEVANCGAAPWQISISLWFSTGKNTDEIAIESITLQWCELTSERTSEWPNTGFLIILSTMVDNSQAYRLKYWATRSSVCSWESDGLDCYIVCVFFYFRPLCCRDSHLNAYLSSGHVTLNVLDCAEFLESISIHRLKDNCEDQPTKSLIYAVIMFSCFSLIGAVCQ